MEEKKNRKGMEFQQSHRKEFHYQRPEVNRIIMPEEKDGEKPKRGHVWKLHKIQEVDFRLRRNRCFVSVCVQ